MKSITVEISWMGDGNYHVEDIRYALVKQFKSCNFHVEEIPQYPTLNYEITNSPDTITAMIPLTATTPIKNIS